ncbi:unnamed protein product [Onchocerca flexuosa]|uniref:Uncharacterized protein n=1 Tax=Onchocerca flexuosa TaxID=387005 RepID=A0A183H420_9BILA|nr:unnamed protein product [Onchocerca flexuosa]
MSREIIPQFIQKLMEYEQWILDEQKKAEQILKDCGYTVPKRRARINIWPEDFQKYFKMPDEYKRNKKNEACSAVNGSTSRKVRFRSKSSRFPISSPSDDCSLTIRIAKAIRIFCAEQTTNATSKKRKISETAAEEMPKSRGNRGHRTKQPKKKLKKVDKQRRNQIVEGNKLQAFNAAVNMERKFHKLSATRVAKPTLKVCNTLDSIPIV